jgi:hypothetical protein
VVVKITGGKRWLVALDYPERKGEVTQYPWVLRNRPAPTHTTVSKLSRACAAFTWAKSIRHIRVSLSPRIWPARFTELLGEVLAATLPGRCDSIDLAIIATASSRQPTDYQALLVQDVKVPPLHRLDMVAAGHRGHGSRAFLRPQGSVVLDLQYEGRRTRHKPLFHHTPSLPKPKQLPKRLLGCHRPASSCGRQAPVSTRNDEELLIMSVIAVSLALSGYHDKFCI